MSLRYYLSRGDDPRQEVAGGVLQTVVSGKRHVVTGEIDNEGAEEVTLDLSVTGKSLLQANCLASQTVTPSRVTIPAGGSVDVTIDVSVREGNSIGQPLTLTMHATPVS